MYGKGSLPGEPKILFCKDESPMRGLYLGPSRCALHARRRTAASSEEITVRLLFAHREALLSQPTLGCDPVCQDALVALLLSQLGA